MSFRETIREQIIGAIVTGLADIRTTSGYNVDLGSTVKRGQIISDKDVLPAVAAFPLGEDNEPIPGRNNLTMTVRIEGLAKFGNKNPSVVAEAMLGDIIYRMTHPSLSISALSEKIEYAEGGVDEYPDPGQYAVGCYAIFNVNYKTKIGDPFIQSDSLLINRSDMMSVSESIST